MARSKSSTCLLARAPRAAGNRPIALAVLMASLSAWDLGTKPWTAGALLLVSVAPQASGPLEVSSAPETSGPSWAPRGSLLRGGEEKKKKASPPWLSEGGGRGYPVSVPHLPGGRPWMSY